MIIFVFAAIGGKDNRPPSTVSCSSPFDPSGSQSLPCFCWPTALPAGHVHYCCETHLKSWSDFGQYIEDAGWRKTPRHNTSSCFLKTKILFTSLTSDWLFLSGTWLNLGDKLGLAQTVHCRLYVQLEKYCTCFIGTSPILFLGGGSPQ